MAVSMRTTLTPPAVLPEQEPITPMMRRMIHVRCGHARKFSVVKPVVLIIETTLNSDSRKPCSLKSPASSHLLSVMIVTASTTRNK